MGVQQVSKHLRGRIARYRCSALSTRAKSLALYKFAQQYFFNNVYLRYGIGSLTRAETVGSLHSSDVLSPLTFRRHSHGALAYVIDSPRRFLGRGQFDSLSDFVRGFSIEKRQLFQERARLCIVPLLSIGIT